MLFAFQIKSLLVNQSVKLLDLIEGLGDFKFEVTDVSAQVVALICLDLVSHIKSVDFFKVFPIALSKGSKLVISLSFLRLEASICILTDLLLVFHSLNVNVAVTDQSSLPVKFGIQLRILALAVVVNLALLIDLRSERLDESDVRIDSRLVVLVHSPLVFIQTAEILL